MKIKRILLGLFTLTSFLSAQITVTKTNGTNVIANGPVVAGPTSTISAGNGGYITLASGGTFNGTGTFNATGMMLTGFPFGTGTVTSVSGSGGTTGLTLTGGPVTTTGTLTLGGTLVVANGGTGASTFSSGLWIVGNGTGALQSHTLTVGSGLSLTTSGTTTTLASTGTGTGTVTSVSGSGGTTGLTLTGGPVTTTGTLTLGGTLTVANGGTGATTSQSALTNLGAVGVANANTFTATNSFTGPLTVTTTSNTLFVDAVTGNDTTAKVGQRFLAWKTVAAAAATSTTGQTIYCWPGTFTESSTVLIPSGVRLTGAGSKTTTIAATTNMGAYLVANKSYVAGGDSNIEVDNLTFNGNGASQATGWDFGQMLFFNGVDHSYFHDLSLINSKEFNLHLPGLSDSTIQNIYVSHNPNNGNGDGVHLNGPQRVRVVNVHGITNDAYVAVVTSENGVVSAQFWAGTDVDDVTIEGVTSEGYNTTGSGSRVGVGVQVLNESIAGGVPYHHVRNVFIDGVHGPFDICAVEYSAYGYGGNTGGVEFDGIHLSNVGAVAAQAGNTTTLSSSANGGLVIFAGGNYHDVSLDHVGETYQGAMPSTRTSSLPIVRFDQYTVMDNFSANDIFCYASNNSTISDRPLFALQGRLKNGAISNSWIRPFNENQNNTTTMSGTGIMVVSLGAGSGPLVQHYQTLNFTNVAATGYQDLIEVNDSPLPGAILAVNGGSLIGGDDTKNAINYASSTSASSVFVGGGFLTDAPGLIGQTSSTITESFGVTSTNLVAGTGVTITTNTISGVTTITNSSGALPSSTTNSALFSNGSNVTAFATSGTLGVGTGSPGLTINGGTTTNSGASVLFQSVGSYIGGLGRQGLLDGTNGSTLQLQSQGGVNLRVGTNGNQVLELFTNAVTSASLSGQTMTLGSSITTTSTTLALNGGNTSGVGAAIFIQSAGGNIGLIGPDSRISGSGTSTQLDIKAASGNGIRIFSNSANPVVLGSNNTDVLSAAATGVTVTGSLTVTGIATGKFLVGGGTSAVAAQTLTQGSGITITTVGTTTTVASTVSGNVTGAGTTVAGNVPAFADTTGTTLTTSPLMVNIAGGSFGLSNGFFNVLTDGSISANGWQIDNNGNANLGNVNASGDLAGGDLFLNGPGLVIDSAGNSSFASGVFSSLSVGGMVKADTSGLLSIATAGTDYVSPVGVSNASNATAGNLGEFATATLATGSSVSVTSGTAKTVTSVSLTAGDWDVWAVADYTFGATTSVTYLEQGISTTTNTLGGQDTFTVQAFAAMVPTAAVDPALPTPHVRINVSGTTTVYLVVKDGFTLSTLKAYGSIFARRVR